MSALIEANPIVGGGLVVLGSIVALAVGAKALSSFYKTFLRPGKDLKKLGEWAVVTGATDGIGKAYAMALAKKGINIVLISRTESKLQEVKKEIDDKGYAGVTVKYLVCDYCKFDKKAQDTVKNQIKDLDIGVLINNVGMGYRYPRYFHELPDEEVQNLLTVNIDSTVWMTRMVLGGMVERKRGAIVNLSSGSAMYTLPLLAEYSAAKSFIEKFSRALNAEYQSKGVTCQCQIPFYVATKLAKLRKSFTVPTPTDYVKVALNWVGYPDAVASPYWIHAVQGWVLLQLPDAIVSSIIMNMHQVVRKKGLKKDERLAAEAGGKKTQ